MGAVFGMEVLQEALAIGFRVGGFYAGARGALDVWGDSYEL